MTFGLIIPCFNFEKNLEQTFARISAWREAHQDCRVYFVDDGSTDNTWQHLTNYAAKNPNWCRAVRLKANSGKGAAVRAGFLAAQDENEYIVFTDCDLHYGLDIISDRVIPELKQSSDIVIVNRTWDESSRHISLRRRIASGIFNRAVGTLNGLTYCDSQAGLKGFRTEVCKPLFLMQRIKGFTFDVEILSVAFYYGLRVLQIPISFSEDYSFPEESTIKLLRNSLIMLIDLLRINFNWKRGRYQSLELLTYVQKRTYTIHSSHEKKINRS